MKFQTFILILPKILKKVTYRSIFMQNRLNMETENQRFFVNLVEKTSGNTIFLLSKSIFALPYMLRFTPRLNASFLPFNSKSSEIIMFSRLPNFIQFSKMSN